MTVQLFLAQKRAKPSPIISSYHHDLFQLIYNTLQIHVQILQKALNGFFISKSTLSTIVFLASNTLLKGAV